MSKQKDIYLSRIEKVQDYVLKYMDQKLLISDLAHVAHFSSFHFHRVFQAIMNESVNQYITRTKLEKATQKLSYTNKSIQDIALEYGFSSVATFSRSFKQYFDCSPTQYRKHGLSKKSKICKNAPNKPEYIYNMNEKRTVIIKELEFKKLAYITVYDSFKEGKVLNNLHALLNWAKETNFYEKGELIGMSLDDIMVTPKEKYRYLIAITIDEAQEVQHPVIKTMEIPKSKYATLNVEGNLTNVGNAWHYLYTQWLINSDYEPNHLYAFEKFLNKEKAGDWSHFQLEIALPIKKLIHY